ncbi:MAG: hypothetical protein ABF868_06855 [Sporolactobacillus sp.]
MSEAGRGAHPWVSDGPQFMESIETVHALVAQMQLSAQTDQILTVIAEESSAVVIFWQKNGDGWQALFTTPGKLGRCGVGSAHEGSARTPLGAYPLGFAFGTSNPGTSLPFRLITARSYWISNPADSAYNTWQERDASSPLDEHLADYPVQYQYAVVIDYNTARIPGAGSGFFLHCTNGHPTAGCVAIPTTFMCTAMQRLHGGAYIVHVTSAQQLLDY